MDGSRAFASIFFIERQPTDNIGVSIYTNKKGFTLQSRLKISRSLLLALHGANLNSRNYFVI